MFKGILERSAHTTLTTRVAEKAGLKFVQGFDCLWLSFEVQRITGRRVSETTLKRFFGAAAVGFQFSSATKNTLTAYIGYPNWTLFVESLTDLKLAGENGVFWNKLKKIAARVSKFTIQALKSHSLIPFENTIPRQFAESHLEDFLENDYSVTSFIAPGGYGKSILIAHLIDKYWLGEDAVFPNDIVWVITADSIGGLTNVGFDLNEWFINQTGLNENENVHLFLKDNPGEVHGRIVMVLDGFDDALKQDGKIQSLFTKILDLITVNRECRYLKVILGLRPSTWDHVSEQVNSSSFIKSHWHLGNTYQEGTRSNVPQLTEPEVRKIMDNLFSDSFVVKNSGHGLIQLLSSPPYFELLNRRYGLMNRNESGFLPVDYFDLIFQFIKESIYQNKLSTYKLAILKRFLEHSNLSDYKSFVDKECLLTGDPFHQKAYEELLACGILLEENVSTRIRFRKIVLINQKFIIEYFIAMEFRSKHRKKNFPTMYFKAHTVYINSTQKIPILRWLRFLNADQKKLS